MNAKVMLGLLFSAAIISSGCTRTVVVERQVGIPDAGVGNGGGYGAYGGGNGADAGGGSGRNGGGQGGADGSGRNGTGGGQYGGGQGGQYGGNGGGAGGGQYGNANGSSQYSPADLRNPSSILAQRVIYFDYDQSTIRPEFQRILDAHASLLFAWEFLHYRPVDDLYED